MVRKNIGIGQQIVLTLKFFLIFKHIKSNNPNTKLQMNLNFHKSLGRIKLLTYKWNQNRFGQVLSDFQKV